MVSLIVAYDDNRMIGKDGQLPWHFKEDLAYFKRVTEHHPCVMGRVTYESILSTLKKPLPNRKNIVVTRQNLTDPGIEVVHDLEALLTSYKERDEELFVIGGRLIYTIALPYADRLYITHIKGEYDGDTLFPEVDFSKYERIYYDEHEHLCFAIYERK